MIRNDAKDSLPYLLVEADKQLQWIVKEIVKQNREYKDLLVKVVELNNNYKENLILQNDIPDRIQSIVNEFLEVRK